MKRTLSILLCLSLIVSTLSFPVSAAETDEAEIVYTDNGTTIFHFEAPFAQTAYQHSVAPCSPASIVVTDTFTNEIYDSTGTLAVRFRVTVTGIFLTDSLLGEITSVTCNFMYTNNSHYTYVPKINGNRATVGINLDNFRLGTYTYRITDNGNIVQS